MCTSNNCNKATQWQSLVYQICISCGIESTHRQAGRSVASRDPRSPRHLARIFSHFYLPPNKGKCPRKPPLLFTMFALLFTVFIWTVVFAFIWVFI